MRCRRLSREFFARAVPGPDVFCFDNIPEGIKHFAGTLHVKADELLTPEETEQIKKEQDALPPIGCLTSGVWNTSLRP
jgi:hypothetical protein